MACQDGTAYPAAWRATRAAALAQEFEAIRAACGNRSLRVLSAYRTPAHNRRVGGARNSQHVEGRALDLAVPAGMSIVEFWRTVKRIAIERGAIRGLGLYPTFVHIDIRPGRLVTWTGTRLRADLEAA